MLLDEIHESKIFSGFIIIMGTMWNLVNSRINPFLENYILFVIFF